ncbi:MAG: polysaccharide deacetylase family protein, partial [Bacillota bacterium]
MRTLYELNSPAGQPAGLFFVVHRQAETAIFKALQLGDWFTLADDLGLSPLYPLAREHKVIERSMKWSGSEMIWDLRRFRPLWQALMLTLVLVALAQLMQSVPTLDRFVWSRIQEAPVYRSGRQDKAVALTFDTVWGTDYSQEIINVLQAHQVPATFFIAGWWAQRNPDALKSIIAAGHEVGNATQNYLHLRALSEERAKQEFRDCHHQLELAMGKRATLFRPPYGEHDTRLGELAKALGYRTVLWSVDP